MTAWAASEDALAEQPALAWLCGAGPRGPRVGWQHVHGADLAPDAPARERKVWSDVVLVERLRGAVARINPRLPAEAVARACDLALSSSSPAVVEDHRAFHELLLSGVPVSYVDDEGIERHDHAWLVDFENPAGNEFLAVNQLTIIVGQKNRRPDILLFVNGLPLGQVELKAPGVDAREAVNQVHHYRDTIPGLYRYVEIIGVSNLTAARVGTITTPAEHFAEWKTMGVDEEARGRSQLEVMIEGVFAPERFLELIRDFVLFESDGARTWKVLAKYHQVHAVTAAVESCATAINGDRRGGLVWHTQGAGKSYSMVFFVNKLRRDRRFGNPTVVAVTDRTDLDNQLSETFTGTHLAASCRQAEEITGGPRSLHQLLRVPAGGIVFTTIQKFAPPTPDGEMPVLCARKNVVVIADEAHRSQYATYAQNITLALPNATRIGFTGTPVESADRSTRLVFGDYISIYRMRQAQEDRATVPIYYESRQIPLNVADSGLLASVEEVLESEEQEAASRLVTAWAKLEKVVGAPDRMERLAEDVHAHFTARCEVLAGKGMVVAYSRRIAAELTVLLRERFGDDAVDCVISAQATDPPEISRFRRSKAELRQLAKDFKDPSHPLRVVVVKDMWLTGFDAPVLHTLYIDKPMRDHGLLQAIARVNRVFRDKPGGLVVDYIGIGEDLRASLRAYDEAELEDPVIPAAKAVAGVWERYEVICALLYPAGYRQGELHLADASRLFVNAAEHLLGREERTRGFLDAQAALASWYALARTQQPVIELREEIAFFNRLAAEVRTITTPDVQASPAAEQAVRQFMSEGLSAGEIVDVLTVSDDDRPEISVLSDEFLDSITAQAEHPNIQVRLLEKLLKGEIQARGRANRTQAKIFSEQIEAVLRRYAQRQLTSAEVVARLVEIAKSLRDARHRHEQLGLSIEEAAFYDALAGHTTATDGADPQLAAIAAELVNSIRADLTVDWADRQSSEAAIRRKIKRLLRRHEYRPVVTAGPSGGGCDAHDLNHYTQLVLEQAKELYRYWPETEERLLA